MNEGHHHQPCELCHQRADVWCRQDRAYLCNRCDQDVHSAGPLAWKHERTRLPGRPPFLQVAEPNEDARDAQVNTMNAQVCHANRFDTGWPNVRGANFLDGDGLTATHLEAAGIAAGFQSAQLRNEDDILDPVRDPFEQHFPQRHGQSLEHWPGAAAVRTGRSDTSTSERAEQDKGAESPSPLARTTSSQHMSADPFSNAQTCTGPGPQMGSDLPDVYPVPICAPKPSAPVPGQCLTIDPATSSGELAQAQAASTQSAAAFAGLPMASPAMQLPNQFPGAMMPMMAMQAPWPYYMPQAGWAPYMAHATVCSTYIPASLRPPADEAARDVQLRQRRQKYKRFYLKKQQISSGQRTVKYAERKKFADARPRLHGRFIPKALLPRAGSAADGGADTRT